MTGRPGASGRPHSPQRSAALIVGDRTYQGKRCLRCGGATRYTKGSGCVACQKTSAIEARQLLRAKRREAKRGTALAQQKIDHAVPANPLTDELDFLDIPKLAQQNPQFQPTIIDGVIQEEGINSQKFEASDENASFAVPCCAKTKTPDPEPLCPECGCNVEADWTEASGWLMRVSPWRCSICDWVDSTPAIDSNASEE